MGSTPIASTSKKHLETLFPGAFLFNVSSAVWGGIKMSKTGGGRLRLL